MISKLSRRSFATLQATKIDINKGNRPSLSGFWMPFTDHDRFKKNPKIISRADGMYYYTEDNDQILDGTSGLWCSNAGHNRQVINDAVKAQLNQLDFVPNFNITSPAPIRFAEKLIEEAAPTKDITEVFFTNCGSTAVDTALKIALHYQKARGLSGKTRIISRERGYHGVNFGGISVGGIMANRKYFANSLVPNIDHLSHTHSPNPYFKGPNSPNSTTDVPPTQGQLSSPIGSTFPRFVRGQPPEADHLYVEFDRMLQLHDPSTIAAVIVEPVAGSTGVLPPPVNYLETLQAFCKKHDILFIVDEVITGFGRLGSNIFASANFNLNPDLIICAKGLTNAVVPAGAVLVNKKIMEVMNSDAHLKNNANIMANPAFSGNGIPGLDMSHGYTYSGHPLAMAAGLANLQVFKEDNLLQRGQEMSKPFEDMLHSLSNLPHVSDVRNIGMMGAVEFNNYVEPESGIVLPTARPMDVYDRCFKKGLLVRASGNAIALSPPLIVNEDEIKRMGAIIAEAIEESSRELKLI